MRLACTSFSFNRAITAQEMTLDHFLQFCKELGIVGVEIWDEHLAGRDDAYLKSLKRKCDDLGLELLTVAVNNHGFSSHDPGHRRAEIDMVKNWVDRMLDVGCAILRILPGDLRELNARRAETYAFALESLEECAAYAEARGLTLAVENCPRHQDSKVVADLLREVNSKYLRACPDTGNLPDDIRYDRLEELVPFAVHVHAKAHEFTPDGREAHIDYARVFDILEKFAYDGYVSVEYEGAGDEREGVRKTVALLKRYMAC